MTRDLVLIPTYRRPDYLSLCLEHILRCPAGARDIWLVEDRHLEEDLPSASDEEEMASVVAHFQKHLNLRHIVRQPHPYPGNSFNVLEAYREAYQTTARYVYLLEDDVLVTEDFFRWHECVQEQGDYFCSIGYRCHRNPRALQGEDPEGYLECRRDYASIGVCWRRSHLAPVVAHAVAAYYRDPVGYVRNHFPAADLPASAAEQDGLILRLARADGRPTAWASLPRAYHIGVWGYHRINGIRFVGSLAERVAALRQAAARTESLRQLSRDAFHDVEAPPARVPAWTEQKVIQRLE